MSTEIRYLILCGFDTHIEYVVGPFLTESDAMLVVNALSQLEYDDGDRWMQIEEREVLTL